MRENCLWKVNGPRTASVRRSLGPVAPMVPCALIWMAGGLVLCGSVGAQCYVDPYSGQQVCNRALGERGIAIEAQRRLVDADPASPGARSAHCRIMVDDGSTGSGTLVARNGYAGLVLTCSHLFDGSTSGVVVAFPDGRRFAARVLERDRAHDLAALVIHRPEIEPVPLGQGDVSTVRTLVACGYGARGQFRCVRGKVVGQATPVGASHPSITIRASVRPGDSGGAVLDERAMLVGVVWGERDGLTYVTCGEPLRSLLARVLGTRSEGRSESGAERQGAIAESRESKAEATEAEGGQMAARIATIEHRVSMLDATKQDKGEYLRADSVGDFVHRDEIANLKTDELVRRADLDAYTTREHLDGELTSLLKRFATIGDRVDMVRRQVKRTVACDSGIVRGLATGKLVAGALGIGGPLAIGVIAARALAGKRFWLRRIWAKRGCEVPTIEARSSAPDARHAVAVAVDTPPLAQQTVTETHYVPYETDSFAKAHQWASEQVARKYPGATEVLSALDSLIKQYLIAQAK